MQLIFSSKIVICAMILCVIGMGYETSAQDTLHLNYHYTQMKAHDSTVAKIDNWAKSLNGRHINLNAIAYYHKSEFKPAAVSRNEDLFLVLNRKARSLITIESMEAKKGKESQRTRVDIVYTFADGASSDSKKIEPVKVDKKQEAVKSEVVKEKEKTKEAKESAQEKVTETKKNVEEKKKEVEKTVSEEKPTKSKEALYVYDSIYVNGVLEVTKRKIKRK